MKGEVSRTGEKVIIDMGGKGRGKRGGMRFAGVLSEIDEHDRSALFNRTTSRDEGIRTQVEAMIEFVRDTGDEALRGLTRELDGVKLENIEVSREAIDKALASLDPELRAVMERSARNIRRAHEAFRPTSTEVETEPGVIVGRRPDPLARVGVYAPGGRAVYPSSVLMGVVPAKVAGVTEVIVCSPPGKNGRPSDLVLAAAAIAGADRVFAVGGAQAVAAMAFGTATVPRVDRIVGPGNAFVAEAKVQLASVVGIDSPAGPSELLVIADETADANTVARELVAQAEHDPKACVIAVTTDVEQARNIARLLEAHMKAADRKDIVGEAIATRGGILVAESLEDAASFANEYAAEHVLLAVSDPDYALTLLRNAGTVFLGASSSVAFGDYMTGANHVLPTGGLARSYSGLSTLDFIRWTTYQRVSPEAALEMADAVGIFADAEGLPGHANAARSGRAGGATE